ncbi:MAG: CheR family methyltransferase [Bacillota bacterium]|nr:CheR family methyltransferase [Bacillota bacterium]
MISITDKEFEELVIYIKQNYGINLIEKRSLLESRLQGVLTKRECSSFSEYFRQILRDKSGELVDELLDKVTTNYTFFLREKKHFHFYKNTVLPYVEKKYAKEKDLRIWSAGCSSGEEAFTLAMINNDYFENGAKWDKKILATDICSEVLETAVKGEYEHGQLAMVPEPWKASYFQKTCPDKSKVTDRIKKDIIFRRFNLMNKAFPFKRKFHAIFCRNVMIYFDEETKSKLVNRFYNSLEQGGYLFVGSSESLNYCHNNRFKYVMPSVYQKQ